MSFSDRLPEMSDFLKITFILAAPPSPVHEQRELIIILHPMLRLQHIQKPGHNQLIHTFMSEYPPVAVVI